MVYITYDQFVKTIPFALYQGQFRGMWELGRPYDNKK